MLALTHRAPSSSRSRPPGALLLFAVAFALLILPSHTAAQDVVLRATAGTGFEDGYDFGFGGSAGIQFPLIGGRPFFLGGRVMRHAGGERDFPEKLVGAPDLSGDLSQLQYGLEFGATWVESPVILRTSGGIGVARLRAEPGTGGEAITESRLLLSPGLILALPISGGRSFIGVEAKWLKISDIENALALYGTAGVKLGG